MRSLVMAVLALQAQQPATAQDARPIRRGESIAATLTGETRHRYTLDLDSNTFVLGDANQLTVDVVVRILGPDGALIRAFDSPDRGPELFNFDSRVRGLHTIEVTAFEKGSGNYVITLQRVERVARDPRARVDQLLAGFAGPQTPGAVVGVVQDGKLAFTRAYGAANLSHGIPFTTGTISNIGSVTKQFTAMSVLLLQADGKLSLDDDIRKHIPELPDFGQKITLRNLLNHTGGYREIYNLLPITGFNGEDAYARENVIGIVQRQPELQAAPNTEFNYNNTGYILLGLTVERVSGMSFPAFMKTRLFDPLGMTHTRLKANQGEVIPGSAQGYVLAQGGSYREARDLPASAGAGGIYTTVEDLATWMLNYREPRVGGADAIKAITTNTKLVSGDSTGYGLGMGIGKFRGRTRYAHTGGDVAHRAYFGYYPELASGVIVLSSNGSFNLAVATDIALAFFGDKFEPAVDSTPATTGTMSPRRVRAIAGNWRITAPTASLDIVYSVDNGRLFAQATGQPRFPVIPTSDSTARFDGVPATVTFHFENDTTVTRATHHQGGAVPMKRVMKVPLTADALRALEGRYYSEELQTWYELKLGQDTLRIHHVRMAPINLTHREGDEFSGSAFFLTTVKFMRAGNGAVTGFMVSNGRTKNVWFARR